MAFCISSKALGEALGASKNSVTTWTRGLPRQRAEGEVAWYYMRLSDIVPSVRQRRLRGLAGGALARVVVLDSSQDDPSEPLGEDADRRAVALHECLTEAEKRRFAEVTDSAAKAATEALWGRGHLYNLGRCLGLLILRPAVLAYTLTGKNAPEINGEYIAQHIVSVATPTELKKLAG